jgi:hypothetical protein
MLQALADLLGCTLVKEFVTLHHDKVMILQACESEGGVSLAARFPNDPSVPTPGYVKCYPLPAPNKSTLFPEGSELITLPPPFAEEEQDLDKLFDDILAFVRRYVTLTPEFSVAVTAWIIATWVHTIFDAFPILSFYGMWGAGKTRAEQVLQALCCRAMIRQSNVRETMVVHSIHLIHPTMFLDEQDANPKSDMRDVVRNGFQKDGFVIRGEKIGGRIVMRKKLVYCPKVFSGQEPFSDPAMISRVLSENMAEIDRAPEVAEDIDGDVAVAFAREAAMLQRRAFRWSLDNYHSLKPARPDYPGLDDRGRQVFRPLVTVTPSMHLPQLRSMMHRYLQIRSRELSETLDGRVMEILLKHLSTPDASMEVRPGALAVAVMSANGIDVVTIQPRSPGYVDPQDVGRILRRHGITKLPRDNDGTRYLVKPVVLAKLRRAFEQPTVPEPDPPTPEPAQSEASESAESVGV